MKLARNIDSSDSLNNFVWKIERLDHIRIANSFNLPKPGLYSFPSNSLNASLEDNIMIDFLNHTNLFSFDFLPKEYDRLFIKRKENGQYLLYDFIEGIWIKGKMKLGWGPGFEVRIYNKVFNGTVIFNS